MAASETLSSTTHGFLTCSAASSSRLPPLTDMNSCASMCFMKVRLPFWQLIASSIGFAK